MIYFINITSIKLKLRKIVLFDTLDVYSSVHVPTISVTMNFVPTTYTGAPFDLKISRGLYSHKSGVSSTVSNPNRTTESMDGANRQRDRPNV